MSYSITKAFDPITLHHRELLEICYTFFYLVIRYARYRSPNTVRVIKSTRLSWAGHVVRIKECRGAFKILTGTPVRNISIGSPRSIRMDIKEIDSIQELG